MSTLIKNNNKWLKVAGSSGVPPVDVIEEDNMNPVTSNAVAKALGSDKKYMTVPDWANTVTVVTGVRVDTPEFRTIYTATKPCFITMTCAVSSASGVLQISGQAQIPISGSESGEFTYTGLLNTGDSIEVHAAGASAPITFIFVDATPLKLVEVTE